MDVYSNALLDHFEHPRNSGALEQPDIRVRCENPVCGDVLELMLRVKDQRIAEVRFKAQGCVPAMACASALTILVHGKTLVEVADISREDLIRTVDGVPPASMHAVDLAMEALRLGLRDADRLG